MYIAGLDGVRAVSVLIVIASHAGFSMIPGGLGVEFFFVLSGFLITYLSIEGIKKGKYSVLVFFIRRFFRIIPPLIFIYLTFSMLNYIFSYDSFVEYEVSFLYRIFVANYYIIFNGSSGLLDGMGILWSLCVEEHFYFFFPLLVSIFLLTRYPVKWGILLVFVILIFWRFVTYLWFDYSLDYYYYATEMRSIYIVMGSILAAFPILHSRREKITYKYEVVILFVALVTLVLSFLISSEDAYRFFWRDLIHIPVLCLILRSIMIIPEYPLVSILEQRFLRFIGGISYVLYLSHLCITRLIGKYFDFSLVSNFIVILILSVFYAVFVRWLVERPTQRLRNKILQKSINQE